MRFDPPLAGDLDRRAVHRAGVAVEHDVGDAMRRDLLDQPVIEAFGVVIEPVQRTDATPFALIRCVEGNAVNARAP